MTDREDITLRPFQDSDTDFIHYVFSSVRRDMLAGTGATGKQLDALVREQSQLQLNHYQKFTPDAQHDIIEMNHQKVGRIYVHRQQHEIRLVDISLLTEFRNKGIGTLLLQELIDEADEKQVRSSLYVEPYNPAKNLYIRFGFEKQREEGAYEYMERTPVPTS